MYVQLLNGPSTFTTDHCNGQLLNDQLLNDQLHYGQILYDQLFTTNYCTDTVYKTTDGTASFSFVIQPCYKTQPTILRIGINRASPPPLPSLLPPSRTYLPWVALLPSLYYPLCSPERWKVVWLWFAILFSVFAYVSMAGWWTDASTPRLEVAEAALLKQYGQVCRTCVIDFLAFVFCFSDFA